ncbi:COG4223 family protein, partial [Tateyamaria sp. syn59]|uniref:COG4223 family protein n=1 Tax=Tateyamaria sp. syn59 TaxID=2576942 RepID=UPI00351A16B0
ETETRLTALEQELAALPPAADLTPLTEDMARLREESAGGIADLGSRVDALDSEIETLGSDLESRVAALQTRLDEGADGTLAEDAVARWQGEVDELRARLQAQADEIAAMAETAAGEISAAESTAAQLEAEAAAVAARAQARAVLATVEAALETGEPYADTIEELQAASPVEVPEPLVTHAEEGVASRAELIESFPESARAALALARREGLSGEEGGRALGFLRDTFQLRATQPSEGDTVNAVLSRAEAALRDGRLDAALAEIETLP